MLCGVNAPPIAPNLFKREPALCLIGGRHSRTGKLVFPLPADPDYEPVDLPDRGVLWSHTVQRFAPKSPPYQGPTPFEPFALGYVELPGALIVESRLTGAAFNELKVGMPMQLTTLTLRRSPDDPGVTTFAFRPAQEK
jgi:uncharacterized OB-fold protein